MAGHVRPRSLFGLPGIDYLRGWSSTVTDSIWNLLSPVTGSMQRGTDLLTAHGVEKDNASQMTEIQELLTTLYGDQSCIVQKQADEVLENSFHGNVDKFMEEFFIPAVALLTQLKEAEQDSCFLATEVSQNPPSNLATANHSSASGDLDLSSDLQTSSESVFTEDSYVDCDDQDPQYCNACSVHEQSQLVYEKRCTSDSDLSTDCEERESDKVNIYQPFCDKWPLVCNDCVIVNLTDISWDKFANGDLYFYVKSKDSDLAPVELWVKYCIGGIQCEVSVLRKNFGRVFTMETLREEIMSDSTADLGESLHHCLVALETSIRRLRWQDVIPRTSEFNHSSGTMLNRSSDNITKHQVVNAHIQNAQTHSHKGINGTCSEKVKHYKNQQLNDNCVSCDKSYKTGSTNGNHSDGSCQTGGYYSKATVKNSSAPDLREVRPPPGHCTDGREMDKPGSPRSAGLHQHRHLEPPKTILDVDYKLLQSGVAILPGCRDNDGNAVVLIFTNSSLWKNRQVGSTDLARLIMFYYSIPRETVRCRGLTVIADIRGCTASTVNTLLESLYLFEGNIPQAISVVHLLVDKTTQSLVLKSPIYDVHAAFQIDLLLSPTLLYSYISADQLPPALEGTFQYNHDDWIRFHMRLDPFLASCRSVARYLVTVIQELSSVDQVPGSATEASQLVSHHDQVLNKTFNDPRVQRLQQEGDSMLLALEREQVNIGHTDDYRYGMEDITRLYRHVQDSISRLMRLSDNRITRLEKCLQLKDFDEECNKIISWLHTQGNECLQRHLNMADNLKAIRQQQKDFDKFYFAAMTHIEKGNDLLEEASTLSQSGDFDEVTGYKELARMLRRHLQQFSERLEEARERIEGTAKCYQLLDKTYEWALEAMKYVASMKMEHCATPEGLDKLLHSLQVYLQEHPPISEDTFTQMCHLAKKVGNDKLLEQCQTAQNRCLETQKMLQLRGNTLQQFKDQLEQDSSASSEPNKSPSLLGQTQRNSVIENSKFSSYSAVPQVNRSPKSDSSVPSNQTSNLKSNWEPKDTSTPVVPKTYSRLQGERLKTSSCASLSSLSASSPTHSITSPSSTASSVSPCHSTDTSPIHTIITPPPQGPNISSRLCDQNSNRVSQGANLLNSATSSPSVTNSQSVRENKQDSNQQLFSVPNEVPQSNRGTSLHVPSRSKKLLKRAISSPQCGTGIEECSGAAIESQINRITSLRQNGRTDSMITGSSDSLPSLPEEDEGVGVSLHVSSSGDGIAQPSVSDGGSYMRQEWTPVPVNTHLTAEPCTTPVRAQGDDQLPVSEGDLKSRRTLGLVMSEMVQTERDYVCALRYIVENYIPEMEREDVPQALRGKRNVIFGNIEKIYSFHQQYFLQEMEASRRNPFLIARYFLMHENQFHLYALYNKNKPKSDALMAEYGKTFFREKQHELRDKMDLSSYLLKPVQRMGKYALLIKQVLKECPRSAPEYADLKAAEDMVRFQLRHGNDLLAMDALRDCDVNLQEQGKLLRQEEFLVYHGRRKCMRHVFLFEDLILFSKTKRSRSGFQDTYLYKFSFKMSDIGLTQDYEGSGYKFEIWWRRRNTGESYVLQAPNGELKKIWIREMTQVLWNQAIRNRENRLSELATMGIGNKPCLDIKPSSDNIQDRFINIAIGNREPRTRNSIATCSTDHLRQGNKRPHSIISVSSNSSSNSSHSGFNAMNLAFNPVDSPRTYRHSLTFMSTESGIGTSIVSGGDMDGANKFGDLSDLSRAQSPPPYDFHRSHPLASVSEQREFGKPRVMNLPVHSEEVTDV